MILSLRVVHTNPPTAPSVPYPATAMRRLKTAILIVCRSLCVCGQLWHAERMGSNAQYCDSSTAPGGRSWCVCYIPYPTLITTWRQRQPPGPAPDDLQPLTSQMIGHLSIYIYPRKLSGTLSIQIRSTTDVSNKWRCRLLLSTHC